MGCTSTIFSGGFTLTTASVAASVSSAAGAGVQVYCTDGRPDELVRGVDIVGDAAGGVDAILTTAISRKFSWRVWSGEWAGAGRSR